MILILNAEFFWTQNQNNSIKLDWKFEKVEDKSDTET